MEAGVERVGESVEVVEDVFAPPTDEEKKRARAAYDDRTRRHRDSLVDWMAVQLMYARGAQTMAIVKLFGMNETTLNDRARKYDWTRNASDAELRMMARDAYVFALLVGEREGMPEGGEAAIRASLDWTPIRRAGTRPPAIFVAGESSGAARRRDGETSSGKDWRDEGSDHHLPACKACADRQEVERVSSKLEEVALAMEVQVAEESPEAAAFLRTLRLSTQGLLSDPAEHLDADGKLKEWVGAGYSVSGQLPGMNV